MISLFAEKKRPIPPFISVIGTFPKSEKFYVVLEDHLYQVKSISAAIDLCFKCFLTLKKDFACINKHIWCFIKKYVYEISGHDNCVNNLIEKLKLSNLKKKRKRTSSKGN